MTFSDLGVVSPACGTLDAQITGVTADGPLTITEDITAPADNCGLPAAMASY